MATGVLQAVTLGYQLLWNAQRQATGVLLSMEPRPGSPQDTGHLLATLAELWPARAPQLLLGTSHPGLLADLLDLTHPKLAQVEVPAALLADPAIAQRLARAAQRGLPLVWHGQPGAHLMPAESISFAHHIVSLSAEDTLMALRVALRKRHNTSQARGLHNGSPVRAQQSYDGVASRALAEHCLDQQGARALLGWPMEDVLYGYRKARIQPDRPQVLALIKAIEADASMDRIEHLLGEDPMLAYRFLRYINSAGLGLRQEVDALRQGLMVLGLTRTKSWLAELLPQASSDRNLQPVRQAMVLRARFMSELLATGKSEALRRELYLCGLLSQIDLLLGEPLGSVLKNIVLPARVTAALLHHDGPYQPYLALATAVESPASANTSALCDTHAIDIEEVNSALLRTLGSLRSQTQE